MEDKYKTRMTLIQRLQQESKDSRCWEEFVEAYKDYIYVIIRNFNLESTLCEDLLQEVLIRLWKQLPNFEYSPDKCRFRTWLSRVSVNIVKDYLKSRAGRNNAKEIEYDAALHAMDRISEPEIELLAEQEWKLYIAKKAWENIRADLSEKVREIFELSLDEASNKQIAEQFSISENAVRVYKQRGREAMLKEIYRLNKELDS